MCKYRGGNFFFPFFFELGVKLDEESIDDGLKAQKNLENKDLSVESLLWGSCHCPNYRPHIINWRSGRVDFGTLIGS